uniref:Uncharacterized protein n=1 Tax=Scleropages formosus TaxID=113540 RepID=A0A8C9V9S6_SCLFO
VQEEHVDLTHTVTHTHTHTHSSLTYIEDALQSLDVTGCSRDPVDADLLQATTLHLLCTGAHDMGHQHPLLPWRGGNMYSEDGRLLGGGGARRYQGVC